MNPKYIINTGIVIVVAITLVTTRNLKELTADTSMASICSVTFIEPSSAPILEPILPAQIKAVIKDPKALTIAMEIKDGSHEVAPKVSSEGLDCLVNTIPVINPVNEIRGSDFKPT